MTSSFDFQAPASGDMWNRSEALGHLLVIDVEAQAPAEQTDYGTAEPIIATVHDITLQETWEHTKIFTGSLLSALKPRIGSKVLATLTQGAAKPGKNPPYLLADASTDPNAVQQATAYLRTWQAGQYSAPAATQPAATTVTTKPAATAPTGNGVNLNDPTIQAALAALAAQQQGQ